MRYVSKISLGTLLLLSISVLTLWVRSFFMVDCWYFGWHEKDVMLVSALGTLSFQVERGEEFGPFGHDILALNPRSMKTLYHASRPLYGFGFRIIVTQNPSRFLVGVPIPEHFFHWELIVPDWFLFVALFLWPGLRLRRYVLVQRRLATGHCPHCGYDLRATPNRCPECGTITPVKNV
jgi:hypothetical protein